MRHILLIAMIILLGGCSRVDMLEKVSTPADRELVGRPITDIRNGRNEAVSKHLAPELRGQILTVLPEMRRLLPSGEPRLVDAGFNVENVVGQPTVRNSYLAYAVDDPNKHAVIRFGIRQRGSVGEVTDLYVTPLDASIETLTAFSLSGKSALHYLFLALGFASFSTIAVALTLIVKTKGLKRKWLWIVGALIGAGSFAIDWSTGATSVNPFSVQLLGAFAIQPGGLAAWQVGFAIPVVAAAFLVRRKLGVGS